MKYKFYLRDTKSPRNLEKSNQRSWKNCRLEIGNILENSCLRTGTLADTTGFCGNSRLYKGNIFPARKSLVSDMPAGSWERDWDFCYSATPGPDCAKPKL